MTPEEVIVEISKLTELSKAGVEKLYEVENDLAHAEHSLDTIETDAFISHSGSVAERQAWAKLQSAEARLARDLARAEVNRVRQKLRAIESALMAHGTMAKLMQAEMRL